MAIAPATVLVPAIRQVGSFHRIFAAKGTALLAAISIALLLGIIASLFALSERQATIRESVREDAVWAAYQLDRETTKLTDVLAAALAGRATATPEEIALRFDILVSRVKVLQDGHFASKFNDPEQLGHDIGMMALAQAALSPTFEEVGKATSVDRKQLLTLYEMVTSLHKTTERILLTANRIRTEMEVADREQLKHFYAILAGGVLALSIAMGTLVVALARQLRRNESSRRALEALSASQAEAMKLAEAGNRAKSAFLATMSHEIRTPLNGIIGSVDLLDETGLSNDQRGQLATIRECGNSLLDIISDVLDFSKLESGTIELESRSFDIANVVEAAIDIVYPRARLKDIGLAAFYPKGSVVGDETRLRQVLINMIGNAVKFTDSGDVVVTVKVDEADNGDQRLRFSVADTGIGVAPAAQERLFREFSQVDASINRRFGGSGMGLAISRRLVEAMGGEIGMHSREGEGSVFWFTLPLPSGITLSMTRLPFAATAIRLACGSRTAFDRIGRCLSNTGLTIWPLEASADATTPILIDARCVTRAMVDSEQIGRAVVYGSHASIYARLALAVVDGPLTSRRLAAALASDGAAVAPTVLPETSNKEHHGHVLLVEDNAINQRVAAGLLTRLGLTVEIANNGQEAVERAATGGFDLVLMDMQMPVMDGLEATRRIRELPGDVARVPIVGLTANAFQSDKDDCLAAGMDSFMPKPVNREKLETIAAEWLRRTEPDQASEPSEPVAVADPTPRAAGRPPLSGLIDLRQRNALAAELGQDTLDSLTSAFWTDLDAMLAAAAAPEADEASIRRAFHTIKGTAESIGCSAVAEAAAAVKNTFHASGAVDMASIRQAIAASKAALSAEGPAEEPESALARVA